MQICKEHWDKIRTAIAVRGLNHLVAATGEAAVESMERQARGVDTKEDFDPLMNANWAICGAYLNDVGINGMMGEKCPLCEVEKSRAGLANNWIEGCADDQLKNAQELKLIPGVH